MFMIIVLTSFVFFLILRRPPRSTRTDTRFPYTTLFRSVRHGVDRGIKYVASRACRYQVSDSEVSIRRLNRTVSDTFGVRHLAWPALRSSRFFQYPLRFFADALGRTAADVFAGRNRPFQRQHRMHIAADAGLVALQVGPRQG